MSNIVKTTRSCIVFVMFVNFYKIIFQIRRKCIIADLMIKTKLFHSIFNI